MAWRIRLRGFQIPCSAGCFAPDLRGCVRVGCPFERGSIGEGDCTASSIWRPREGAAAVRLRHRRPGDHTGPRRGPDRTCPERARAATGSRSCRRRAFCPGSRWPPGCSGRGWRRRAFAASRNRDRPKVSGRRRRIDRGLWDVRRLGAAAGAHVRRSTLRADRWLAGDRSRARSDQRRPGRK